MKLALAMAMLAGLGAATAEPQATATVTATARAEAAFAVDAPWTATVGKKDPTELHINVMEREHGTLGVSVPLADLAGLTGAELYGTGKPVTFVLRRESGTVTFTGRFANGTGQGTLHYAADPAYFARVQALGVRNDLLRERANVLALPLLDVRSDYIAAMHGEGAFADLSDYLGMRALNARPEVVHELRVLLGAPLRASDVLSVTALGVTPDYVREMSRALPGVSARDLTSLKALDVSADYVGTMRAAGARIRSASDAQSFRALGISPEAVKRAIAHGKPNPSASDVMEISMRY
ncbi:hypothetical protein ACFSCW_05255 [Sphingomonas tabacisoli]|uniref:Uncharacterized protein n=1 Tax=Sphingomonas tabacisoli TaxID=2249466 RepID=A0ABW4I198_9SPHN